jgi:glucose-1-phosphate thymidylyltransferase
VIQKYIDDKDLDFVNLSKGIAWLDTGNPNSLNDASSFVRILEERTGIKIACLEEIAYNKKWITSSQLLNRVKLYGNNSYALYLKAISEKAI